MSENPLQPSDPEVVESLDLDRDFDLRAVMDRSGYPPIRHKSQAWRAQSHLAFPPPPDADPQGMETARRLIKGGKIYLAGIGGVGGTYAHSAYYEERLESEESLRGLLFLVFELALGSSSDIQVTPLGRITKWLGRIGHKLQTSNMCTEGITDLSKVKGDTVQVNNEIIMLWLNIIMTFRNEAQGSESWLEESAWQNLTISVRVRCQNTDDAVRRIEKVAEMLERQARAITDRTMYQPAKWLLTFDNVDRHDVLDDCWPAPQHGAVLVTTRDVLVASLPIDWGLEVNEFDSDQGAEFLLHMAPNRRRVDGELEAAREVAKQLGGLLLKAGEVLEGPAGDVSTRKLIWGYNTSQNYYCLGQYDKAELILTEALVDADRLQSWYMQV
ncbi:hypothetical protein ACJZ2D_012951 [Fusarium nematophilum]